MLLPVDELRQYMPDWFVDSIPTSYLILRCLLHSQSLLMIKATLVGDKA